MTITREQVADLQPGDVVRVTGWQGLTVEGPLSTSKYSDTLWLGEYLRLTYDCVSRPPWMDQARSSLTVVSRAPRPLYVNHPRTEPVPKDVVLAPDGNGEMQVWICITYITGQEKPPHFVKPERHGMSHALPNGYPDTRMCQPFRLLVDGETGQVVQ